MKLIKNGLFLSLVLLLLSACSGNAAEDFPQSALKEPSSILIRQGDKETVCQRDEQVFQDIFAAIEENWWQTPVGEYQILQKMDAPVRVLRTVSQEELDGTDTMILFSYDEPVIWNSMVGEEQTPEACEIRYYLFLLPNQASVTGDKTKGAFLISEDENFCDKPNVYQYYYNNDFLDSFS